MSKTIVVKRQARKKPATRRAPRRDMTPYPRRYQGQGDYRLYKAPRALRPSKQTQSSLGGTIGSYLGHGLHTIVKALTGFGDYEIQQNSLMPAAKDNMTLAGDPPVVQNTKNNSFIVHHREYISDVFANTVFTANSFSINPGLIQSFPWLSQVADSFEQYRFRGLVFEYKTMSSDAILSNNASSALGTVIMSTQYNALDAPFTDKRTMENYEFANSCKPSCNMLHPVECKMSQTSVAELYIRTGTAAGDLRLYDLGTFTIAVQGMQNAANNQVVGELWCSFEIEFYKPKLLVGGGALLSDHFAGKGSGLFSVGAPFGGAGNLVRTSGSNLGCSILLGAIGPYSSNSIIWPAFVVDGLYKITYIMIGTVGSVNSPHFAPGTAINVDVVSTSVQLINGDTSSAAEAPGGGSSAADYILVQICKITQTTPGAQAGLQFTFANAMPGGTQSVDIFIEQLAPSLN